MKRFTDFEHYSGRTLRIIALARNFITWAAVFTVISLVLHLVRA
ncbi:hypothetical protein ACRS85_21615 [Pluralibacter gergoviae]